MNSRGLLETIIVVTSLSSASANAYELERGTGFINNDDSPLSIVAQHCPFDCKDAHVSEANCREYQIGSTCFIEVRHEAKGDESTSSKLHTGKGLSTDQDHSEEDEFFSRYGY